jgi:putative photosynthetic complex assembly protein 2
MFQSALAVAFGLFMWWFSTGTLLYVVKHLPARTILALATALAMVALLGIRWFAFDPVGWAPASYGAFVSALVLWAWHEMTFLLGIVTGPRRLPCPSDATGWRRFRLATEVVLHHELALAVTMALVVALSWEGSNQVGPWTFGVLWIMRLSAKFNLFLGVSNFADELVPPHLAYMQSYFRRQAFSPLMPLSIAGCVLVTLWLAAQVGSDASTLGLVGATLVATLLLLAGLEHVFLAVRVPDAVLWRWALRPR